MNKSNTPKNHPDSKILLIKLGAVGDLVMASAFFEGVRQSFPKARISHLVSHRIFHTVKENPNIDQFILANTDAIYKGGWIARLREVFRLVRLLRKEQFDQVFVLHWAWQFNLLAWMCRVPIRVGFSRKLRGLFLTHRVRNAPERNNREAYLDLLKAVGKPVGYQKSHYYLSDREDRFLDTFIREHRIGDEELLVALAPGGGRNIKQTMLTRLWPVDRFEELLDRITQAGPHRIVLIAGPEDGPAVQPLLERYPQCIDTRSLSFGEKASIFRRCHLLVGNDSAPIHIAAAMDLPTYSLWGPTDPTRYADPSPLHTPFSRKMECSPCYSNGEYPDCNDNQCMQAITVEEVWQKVQAELNRKTSKPAAIDIPGREKEFPSETISAPQVAHENPNPSIV